MIQYFCPYRYIYILKRSYLYCLIADVVCMLAVVPSSTPSMPLSPLCLYVPPVLVREEYFHFHCYFVCTGEVFSLFLPIQYYRRMWMLQSHNIYLLTVVALHPVFYTSQSWAWYACTYSVNRIAFLERKKKVKTIAECLFIYGRLGRSRQCAVGKKIFAFVRICTDAAMLWHIQ